MQTGTHAYGEPEGGFPDYTDPDDMRRLRAVTSERGWQPDRDDADAIKLGHLYARMDDLCERWASRSDTDPVLWGDAVAATWSEIRATLKGN